MYYKKAECRLCKVMLGHIAGSLSVRCLKCFEVAMVLSNPTCHVRVGEIGSSNIRRLLGIFTHGALEKAGAALTCGL